MTRIKLVIANGEKGIQPYENETHRMEFLTDWKSPEGNICDHWVLIDKKTNEVVDHDKFRYDLAERHNFELDHVFIEKKEIQNG